VHVHTCTHLGEVCGLTAALLKHLADVHGAVVALTQHHSVAGAHLIRVEQDAVQAAHLQMALCNVSLMPLGSGGWGKRCRNALSVERRTRRCNRVCR